LVFRPFAADYADSLLAAAQKAWDWLIATPQRYPVGGFTNPEPSGGPYSLAGRDEGEYRLWAAAALFKATRESRYAEAFAKIWPGRDQSQRVYSLYWWGGHAFACLAYLESAGGDAALKAEIVAALGQQSATVLEVINRTGYNVALTGRVGEFGYDWGSNAMALGYGLWLLLIHQVSPDPQQLAGAAAQLDYVLGGREWYECGRRSDSAGPVRLAYSSGTLLC
jgi:endoglucanase